MGEKTLTAKVAKGGAKSAKWVGKVVRYA